MIVERTCNRGHEDAARDRAPRPRRLNKEGFQIEYGSKQQVALRSRSKGYYP